jgi:hypothetical protein
MKIGEIRQIIDRAMYRRYDLDGHTRDEFARANVPLLLEPLIAELQGLEIKPRFHRDELFRQYQITCLNRTLERWRTQQKEPRHG